MRDWNTTRFNKRIALTEKDLEWIRKNKGKKSAAGFLELIIQSYKITNKQTNEVVNSKTIK